MEGMEKEQMVVMADTMEVAEVVEDMDLVVEVVEDMLQLQVVGEVMVLVEMELVQMEYLVVVEPEILMAAMEYALYSIMY